MATKWEGVNLRLLDIMLSPAMWRIRVEAKTGRDGRWMDGHMRMAGEEREPW